MNMEGPSAKWLQVYKLRYGLGEWEQFIAAVVEQFGSQDYNSAINDLLDLKQTASVEEYISEFTDPQFQVSMHNSGLEDVFFISQFIRGLKPEIRDVVQFQMPATMIKAAMLAKIQQQVLERNKTRSAKPTSSYKFNPGSSRSDSKSFSQKPGLRKERKVWEHRKANDLCFYCGEKFDPAHVAVCTKRPQAQVNAMVLNYLDMPLFEEIIQQPVEED
jgi:hypothetical protein